MDYMHSHPAYETLAADEIRLVMPDIKYAEESFSWVQSIDVVQYMGTDFPEPSIEKERDRIREILENKDGYNWMIEFEEKIIGNIGINSIQESTEKYGMRTGNLVIVIGDKNYWGKGVATKACTAVLEWAKHKGGFTMMTARSLQENIGSIKTLQKLGFKEIGMEPYDGFIQGRTSIWHNYEKAL